MSKRLSRYPIDPAKWLAEWSLNALRVAASETSAAVTPWFIGTTGPARVGYYDRMFTDGLFRHWWDGELWLAHKDRPVPHWRQVGHYPCWRGLTQAAAQGESTGGTPHG